MLDLSHSDRYRVVSADDPYYARLYRTVERLARLANLPVPTVYVVALKPLPTLLKQLANGFPFQSTYYLSDNALRFSNTVRCLSDAALEGAIAHEFGHKLQPNRRARALGWRVVCYLISSAVLITVLLGLGLEPLVAFLQQAPYSLLAYMIPLAVCRKQEEFDADLRGAGLLKNPRGIIQALVEVDPKGAHYSAWVAKVVGLLSMHPSTRSRIARMVVLEQTQAQAAKY